MLTQAGVTANLMCYTATRHTDRQSPTITSAAVPEILTGTNNKAARQGLLMSKRQALLKLQKCHLLVAHYAGHTVMLVLLPVCCCLMCGRPVV